MFMYEKIARQPHLRHGDEVQRMMYRRAIQILRGIKRSKLYILDLGTDTAERL